MELLKTYWHVQWQHKWSAYICMWAHPSTASREGKALLPCSHSFSQERILCVHAAEQECTHICACILICIIISWERKIQGIVLCAKNCALSLEWSPASKELFHSLLLFLEILSPSQNSLVTAVEFHIYPRNEMIFLSHWVLQEENQNLEHASVFHGKAK